MMNKGDFKKKADMFKGKGGKGDFKKKKKDDNPDTEIHYPAELTCTQDSLYFVRMRSQKA